MTLAVDEVSHVLSAGPLDLVQSIESNLVSLPLLMSILSHVHKSSREGIAHWIHRMCAHVVVYEIIIALKAVTLYNVYL